MVINDNGQSTELHPNNGSTDSQAANLFTYVYNDPVNNIDPSGQLPDEVVGVLQIMAINGASQAQQVIDLETQIRALGSTPDAMNAAHGGELFHQQVAILQQLPIHIDGSKNGWEWAQMVAARPPQQSAPVARAEIPEGTIRPVGGVPWRVMRYHNGHWEDFYTGDQENQKYLQEYVTQWALQPAYIAAGEGVGAALGWALRGLGLIGDVVAETAPVAAESADVVSPTVSETSVGGSSTATDATAQTVGKLTGKTIRVYRVEGLPNERIIISESGEVVIQGKDTLYLNFGQRVRAEQYLKQKLADKLPGAVIKSFDVDAGYLDEIRRLAVPQGFEPVYPGRPVRVDVSKAVDQFGIPKQQFQFLRDAIIGGSGAVEKP